MPQYAAVSTGLAVSEELSKETVQRVTSQSSSRREDAGDERARMTAAVSWGRWGVAAPVPERMTELAHYSIQPLSEFHWTTEGAGHGDELRDMQCVRPNSALVRNCRVKVTTYEVNLQATRAVRGQKALAEREAMEGGMQEWPLVVTHFIDFAARYHAEQQVVSRKVEGGLHTCTYKDIHVRSQQCALAMKALGIKPGDRVATLAWNTYRHMECWYALAGIGAVCHTVNPRLFEKDLVYIFNHAQDKIIIADVTFAQLLQRLRADLTSNPKLVFLTDRPQMPPVYGALCYEELLAAQRSNLPYHWEVKNERMACGLCYTSGTTGKPKGVLYSHRSNYLHTMAVLQSDSKKLTSTTVVMPAVPMFHANAWGIVFAAPACGAKLVLPGANLEGAAVYELLESQKVNITAGVPTVWLGLMNYLEERHLTLHHVQCIFVGGSACPPIIIESFMHKRGIEVKQAWGMTELSPIGTVCAKTGAMPDTMTRQQETEMRLKQGRAHGIVDLKIVNDHGQELPWDGCQMGKLMVRGPIVVKQYFRESAPCVDDNGWFDTGDVATIDRHGFLQLVDRSKDIIKSGGEWISSVILENESVSHAKVVEAAVIAIPHRKWGERPLLLVVPKEGERITREEMIQHLAGKVAKWWLPDDVVFVKEIPHTATGKISKLELRKQFQGYKPRSSRL